MYSLATAFPVTQAMARPAGPWRRPCFELLSLIIQVFPCWWCTNYPDHDFPYRNSKVIPSEYMLLQDQQFWGVKWLVHKEQVLSDISTCQHGKVAGFPMLTESYHQTREHGTKLWNIHNLSKAVVFVFVIGVQCVHFRRNFASITPL